MQERALIFVLCILSTDSWCWRGSNNNEGISVLIKAKGKELMNLYQTTSSVAIFWQWVHLQDNLLKKDG